ncbi:glycoside hydrolase superfamily [Apiospora arundinis]|uniref:glucan endo-1,3-beta-D-glucosidase n=1 Tax=Apiospora arundinis TaxID=335852 RepID=A0ABR2JH48_9PEZI
MDRRYSFGSDAGEHAPLDNPNDPYSHSSRTQYPPATHSSPHQQPSRREPSQPRYYQDEPSPSYRDQTQASPARSTTESRGGYRPGGHQDSTNSHSREGRTRGRGYGDSAIAGAGTGAAAGSAYVAAQSLNSSPPKPPPHRENSARSGWSQGTNSYGKAPSNNIGEQASGGLPSTERNARERGHAAMSGGQGNYGQQGYYGQQYGQSQYGQSQYGQSQHSGHAYDNNSYDQTPYGYDNAYDQNYAHGYDPSAAARPEAYSGARGMDYQNAPGGLSPGGPSAYQSGRSTPSRSNQSFASDPFRDPHAAYGQRLDPRLGQVNPNEIMDDGDDGLDYRRPARNSLLSMGNSSGNGSNRNSAVGVAAGGAAAGAAAGGLLGKNKANYGPVNTKAGDSAAGYDLGSSGKGAKETSEFMKAEAASRKRRRWCIIVIFGIVVLGAIAGGVIGGILANRKTDGPNGGGKSAGQDQAENGDLDINSAEIKKLMNNPNLHKVFPGVDYTPLNTQYPDCIHDPPSQNNITRDVAVLSQLTNTIRLYGTDCNQTQMTIHALRQLKMDQDIKIWMGVWQDNNKTTNSRQLAQMWDILDEYGDKPFKGLIVANEILFREQMTTSELGNLLGSVRTNLTSKGMSLPVATSDLGDKWTAELAKVSDYVMANIHPFFGGINAKDAASWTYSFWNNNNGAYFKSDKSKNIISETGWPSQGGTDCGTDKKTDCPDASVAGISQMNQFMEDWVCQALANGTNYFWFEMFDEPWKILFDTPGKEWEDHWGLMTVDRKLKDNVKIPDCGGKKVGPP